MEEIAAFAKKFDESVEVGEERGRQEGIISGHQKGGTEGKKHDKIPVAQNLLKAGVSLDIIAQTTGLPRDEIAQLKEEVTS